MKREFVATTYIFKDDKMLFVYHNKLKKWVPPGGHLNQNELPHEGAIREAYEETGLKINLLSYETFELNSDNATNLPKPFLIMLEKVPEFGAMSEHQHIDFIYGAEVLEGDLLENAEETTGIQWFTLDEVYGLVDQGEAFPETPKVIEFILQQLAIR